MKPKARKFRLFINYFSHPQKRVWSVQVGRGRWRTATTVDCRVPLLTIFDPIRYDRKQQPFAWLEGRGVVSKLGTGLVITNVWDHRRANAR